MGETLGKEHPSYAINLDNLATLYINMGYYEKAELLILEAKGIWERVLGRQHPSFASSLMSLSGLYFETRRYEKAEPLILEARAVQEKVLRRQHPDNIESLSNLATLYAAIGNFEKAEPLYQESSLLIRRLAEKAVRHLSEREVRNYLKKISNINDLAQSFAQESASKTMIMECYDNTLFYKGFLLQTSNQIKRLALSDPATAEKFNQLKSFERRLAAQYTQPIATQNSEPIADLEAKANDLEKDLARTVAGFGQALRQVKWQDVQSVLKPGQAAIEFVSYRFYQKIENRQHDFMPPLSYFQVQTHQNSSIFLKKNNSPRSSKPRAIHKTLLLSIAFTPPQKRVANFTI